MIVSNIYNRLKSFVRDSHCIPETPDGSGGGLLVEDDDNYRQRPFVKTLDNGTVYVFSRHVNTEIVGVAIFAKNLSISGRKLLRDKQAWGHSSL